MLNLSQWLISTFRDEHLQTFLIEHPKPKAGQVLPQANPGQPHNLQSLNHACVAGATGDQNTDKSFNLSLTTGDPKGSRTHARDMPSECSCMQSKMLDAFLHVGKGEGALWLTTLPDRSRVHTVL